MQPLPRLPQFKPRPSIEVSLGPSLNWDKSEAQFLGRVVDPLAVNTYGARYIFASVDQTTLSLDTRVNYTFSPTLSLQVFAQPFIATGKFGAAKEFAEPGTFDFLQYGRDVGEIIDGRIYPNGPGPNAVSFAVPQPDFNVGSLRGNAVLKWDWRPGSTMYLAWQQTRDSFSPIGDFALRRDLDTLFGARNCARLTLLCLPDTCETAPASFPRSSRWPGDRDGRRDAGIRGHLFRSRGLWC